MLDNITICNKLSVLINYYNEFKQLTNSLTIDDYISVLPVTSIVNPTVSAPVSNMPFD